MYTAINFLFYFFIFRVLSDSIRVDCENGNNESSGKKSLGESLQTIEKLNELLTNGLDTTVDQIELKNGCIFTDPLVIEGQTNLTITNYGDSTKTNPEIHLSEVIDPTSWKENGNDIYYSSGIPHTIQYVFVGQERYNMSHYPKDSMEEYFYVAAAQTESTTTTVEVYDKFLEEIAGKDVINADFIVRPKRWAFHKTKLLAVDETQNQITIQDGGSYSPYTKDSGFLLMGKLWMLDYCTGCWHFDDDNKILYIKLSSKLSSKDPKNFEVSYLSGNEKQNYGIEVFDSTNIVLENLKVDKSTTSGLIVHGTSKNIIVRNTIIDNTGYVGVKLYGSDVLFDSNEVLNSGYDGMNAYLAPGIISNSVIKNIFANGVLDVQFTGTRIMGRALTASCSSSEEKCQITGCTVENSGYNGICPGGTGFSVTNNLIKNVCYRADDCGAIYWWSSTPYTSGNHYLANNMILDAVGNSFGTYSYKQGLRYEGAAQGIYPDDRTLNHTIINNTIINCKWNFQLHNSRNNTIEGNMCLKARDSSFYASEDYRAPSGYSYLQKVRNNIFHAQNKMYDLTISGQLGWIEFFTELNNNYYHNQKFLVKRNGTGNRYFNDLESWRSFVNDELGFEWSINARTKIFEYEQYHIIDQSKTMIENGNFSDYSNDGMTVTSWSKWIPSPSFINHQVFEDETGKNYVKIVLYKEPTSTKSPLLAISSVYSVKKGLKYIIEFDMWSETPDVSFSVLCRVNGYEGSYATLGLNKGFQAPENRTKFQNIFEATEDSDHARIDFSTSAYDAVLFLADVKLTQVNVTEHDDEDDYVFFINEDLKKAKEVDLKGISYCDINGNVVDQLILQPLKAEMLHKCFCNGDGKCNNLENANTCPGECVPTCGNDVCESGETIFNCPGDCLSNSIIASFIIAPICIVLLLIVIIVVIIGILLLVFGFGSKNSKETETPTIGM